MPKWRVGAKAKLFCGLLRSEYLPMPRLSQFLSSNNCRDHVSSYLEGWLGCWVTRRKIDFFLQFQPYCSPWWVSSPKAAPTAFSLFASPRQINERIRGWLLDRGKVGRHKHQVLVATSWRSCIQAPELCNITYGYHTLTIYSPVIGEKNKQWWKWKVSALCSHRPTPKGHLSSDGGIRSI